MNNWFVTRAKENLDYQIIEDYDVSEEKDKNVLQDSNIRLTSVKGQTQYTKLLRRVRFWDKVNKKELVFITNNLIGQQQRFLEFIRNDGILNRSLKSYKKNNKINYFVSCT